MTTPLKPPTLYLIDGHALAYRAYFALTGTGSSASQWVTRSGETTAGTYGFTSVLLRLIEQDQPDYLVVCFDVGSTFRDTLYPAYKGTRAKMPDDLRSQLQRIRQVVQAFGVPIYERENYEADDLLGSLCQQAQAKGVQTLIFTGDRDLLQLVNDSVTVRLPGKSIGDASDYTSADVYAKFGVHPSQFVDYKALVGDTSDNIPGVAGIGEKTAQQLLQTYGSLDQIYANLPLIPSRWQSKLAAGQESAQLSRTLSAIVTDLDVTLDWEACRTPRLDNASNFDRAALVELFRELEFRSLLTKLQSLAVASSPAVAEAPAPSPARQASQPLLFAAEPSSSTAVSDGDAVQRPSPTTVTVVDTPAALQTLVNVLAQASALAFDTETTSTDPLQAELVGISLSVQSGQGYYIPIGHHSSAAPNGQLDLATVAAALQPAFSDPALSKYGHNAKYDAIVLYQHGITVAPITFDTMLAEWLSDPGSHNLGLKNLAWVRLGVEMTEIKSLLGAGKAQITMAAVPVTQAAPYAAADADLTLRLSSVLKAELTEKGLLAILEQTEMPFSTVLASMEQAGVLLDTAFLGNMAKELALQLQRLQVDVQAAVGYPFNINSSQQLAKALFETLDIVPPKGTRKLANGTYSTAADVLQDLQGVHPVIDQLLEYRELNKLQTTYVEALPKAVNVRTGRVHTSFNQCGTVTGRLASSDPNLQNIPIRTALGRTVRRAFVAPPGYQLLSCDYSQIELRIAAHFSGDAFLQNAFWQGHDIHTATAAAVFNIKDLDAVTGEQRRQAKAINFGLLYGMGAFRLSRETNITLGEAEVFIETYFARIPGIQAYLDKTLDQARTVGYVETLLGRRRYFPVLQQPASTYQDKLARQRAEREAINSPIQGSAADIIKLAMLAIQPVLSQELPQARMLLQVHDELLFECPTAQLPNLLAIVQPLMTNAYPLAVPLLVVAKSGYNWDQMTEIKS
jgi:DNA polymerase-1